MKLIGGSFAISSLISEVGRSPFLGMDRKPFGDDDPSRTLLLQNPNQSAS
jgi:hypothetical protein